MSIGFWQTDTSKICTAGCGGIINKSFYPQTNQELTSVYNQIKGCPCVILGGMSNTLVLDGYDGYAIFTDLLGGVSVEEQVVTLGCAESISKSCGLMQYLSLSGMEEFYGLPGTVGGAVSGNSGCFGKDVSSVIKSLTVFRLDTGETDVLTAQEIDFGYRYCSLRKNLDLILDVSFSLVRDNQVRIAEKMANVRSKRALRQPKGKSLGSFFKQNNGVSAGYYVEKIGLKGYEKNGVKVSEKHANFLINTTGRAQDYLDLGNYVQTEVYKKLGINLQREIVVVGENEYQANSHARTSFDRS